MTTESIVTHCHNHEWVYDREGESMWLCRCGDLISQYEDCPGGR